MKLQSAEKLLTKCQFQKKRRGDLRMGGKIMFREIAGTWPYVRPLLGTLSCIYTCSPLGPYVLNIHLHTHLLRLTFFPLIISLHLQIWLDFIFRRPLIRLDPCSLTSAACAFLFWLLSSYMGITLCASTILSMVLGHWTHEKQQNMGKDWPYRWQHTATKKSKDYVCECEEVPWWIDNARKTTPFIETILVAYLHLLSQTIGFTHQA